jgi:putative nucleotidyltransferase with HDIG domain
MEVVVDELVQPSGSRGRALVRLASLRSSAQRARLFVVAVAVAAAISLFIPAQWAIQGEPWIAPQLVLMLTALVLEFVEVSTPQHGTLSVSGVAHIAIILIAPPPWGALAVGAAVLVHQLMREQKPLKLLFNVASHVLTVSVATAIVGLIGVPSVLLTSQVLPWGYIAAAVAALTYYAVNVGLASSIVSIASGRALRYVLRSNNRSTILPDTAAQTLGVLLAAAWYAMPAWVVLLALPTAVIGRTLQIIRRLERETVDAVESLAGTIDDRDPATFHHSARVSLYAVALAEAMGLDETQCDLVGSAARVHDLGKMGVTDDVLRKPGPLDAHEGDLMREHARIGARILSRFDLYRPGAALVRAHHERWDGKGYPDGLAGADIPLGARVIAVADAFDAMTSDRPYHKGLHPLLAMTELRAGAGSQWDQVVVAHFDRLLTDPTTELPDTAAIRLLRDTTTRLMLVAPIEPADGVEPPFENAS